MKTKLCLFICLITLPTMAQSPINDTLKEFKSKYELEGSNTDYKIHILGNVRNPGAYKVPPGTRLNEALNQAGSIGSQIEIRRYNSETKNFDIQKYNITLYRVDGDLTQSPFLDDAVVVYVPFETKIVSGN